MKITKSEGEKNKVRLSIGLEASEWNAILDRASGKVSEGLKIDGFREGKVY